MLVGEADQNLAAEDPKCCNWYLKGPIPSLKNWDKTRNQRVITLRIDSACETMEFYR